jgi:hypothetical protein
MPKKSFALRVDEELLNAVEKWAADEFRSTNGQLEWIIAKALKDAGRLKKKKNDMGKVDPGNNNF